jgi:hypothetical protein
MHLEVAVRDMSGAPVADAELEVTIPSTSPLVSKRRSRHRWLVSSYGWGSKPRLIVVRKEHYKPYATELAPQREYQCRVLLKKIDDRGPSVGECVAAQRAVEQ